MINGQGGNNNEIGIHRQRINFVCNLWEKPSGIGILMTAQNGAKAEIKSFLFWARGNFKALRFLFLLRVY